MADTEWNPRDGNPAFCLRAGLFTESVIPCPEPAQRHSPQNVYCVRCTFRNRLDRISPAVNSNSIQFSETRELAIESVLALYHANQWSSAEKPELLHKALLSSHLLVTAWDGTKLVGLGNAISDGYLVVYYPHLLVLPEYQGRGIGTELMRRLMARYQGFHQHMLVADGRALDFYRKCGFERAGKTEPMWIYAGHDH
jgi:GNAT superfamily N-acetyltransferase